MKMGWEWSVVIAAVVMALAWAAWAAVRCLKGNTGCVCATNLCKLKYRSPSQPPGGARKA